MTLAPIAMFTITIIVNIIITAASTTTIGNTKKNLLQEASVCHPPSAARLSLRQYLLSSQ